MAGNVPKMLREGHGRPGHSRTPFPINMDGCNSVETYMHGTIHGRASSLQDPGNTEWLILMCGKTTLAETMVNNNFLI